MTPPRGGCCRGFEIVPYYDRSELTSLTTHTVIENLLVGIGLVVVVLLMFLNNVRTALIVAVNIPLALCSPFRCSTCGASRRISFPSERSILASSSILR